MGHLKRTAESARFPDKYLELQDYKENYEEFVEEIQSRIERFIPVVLRDLSQAPQDEFSFEFLQNISGIPDRIFVTGT